MGSERGVRIRHVAPRSHADGKGIVPGARLIAINDAPVRDELDLVFLAADSRLNILIEDSDGSRRAVTIRKPADDPLGIELDPLKPRRCANRCVFCFVDQNPSGLRKSLHLKDDDLRLSFAHGHYITGTNLRFRDFRRIAAQRLSPLYLSIHTTRHDLRCRMLGIPADSCIDIGRILRFLADRRIAFHGQIVLCPGWNDGDALDRTLDDLEDLAPQLLSVAVVPVGLTIHREGLEPLEPFTPTLARRLIEQVCSRRARRHPRRGNRLVLLSDEFYLLAGEAIPRYTPEETEAQIENGVGMVGEFLSGWPACSRRLPRSLAVPRRVAILTGMLGARVLGPIVDRLNETENLRVDLVAIQNGLFGPGVTVSGLLSGGDFHRALASLDPAPDLALIPANSMRPEDDRFLDDLTLDDLRSSRPDIALRAVEGGACDLAERIFAFASETPLA